MKKRNEFQNFLKVPQINNFVRQQERMLQPFQQIQDEVQKVYQVYQETIIKPIQEMNEMWKWIIEPIQRIKEWADWLKKIEENRRKIFLKAGWWLAPSLKDVPLSKITRVVDLYRQGNKKAIDKFFVRTYRWNNYQLLEEAVKEWNKNLFFKSWMKKIKAAVCAHRRKEYAFSIPVFLIVAEGIAHEYAGKNKIYKEMHKRRRKDKERTPIARAIGIHFIKSNTSDAVVDLDVLISLLENEIYVDFRKLRNKRSNYDFFFNRNIIFHGLQKDYDNQENSLRAFLLLDMLSLLK